MTNIKEGDRIDIKVGETDYSITVREVDEVQVGRSRSMETWIMVRGVSGIEITVPYVENQDKDNRKRPDIETQEVFNGDFDEEDYD